MSQDIRPAQPDGPLGAATATRLIPLYYARDTAKVIATVRGPVEPPFHPPASLGTDRLQMLADQRRLLLSQRAALLAQRAGPTSGVQPAAFLLPQPPATIDRGLAKIERDLTLLDGQEQALRAEAFRDQSQQAPPGTPVIAAARESSQAVDRVRITVVGEGQLHLCGPLEGINAIAQMIHEIDQPVGQVKIGIHVVQFTGTDNAALEGVHGVIDRYLGHARQMSQTAQSLFRTALSNVAARYYSSDPEHFEAAIPGERKGHLPRGENRS